MKGYRTLSISSGIVGKTVQFTSTSGSSEERVSASVEELSDNIAMEIDIDSSIINLNSSLLNLGESPINTKRLRTKKYQKIEAQKISNVISKQIFNVQERNSESDDSDYTNEIIEQFQAKMRKPITKNEKYLILTSLPMSWPIRRIMNEFDVSFFMARRAKNLTLEKGIMVSPEQKLGYTNIDDNIVRLVENFYQKPGPPNHACWLAHVLVALGTRRVASSSASLLHYDASPTHQPWARPNAQSP